MNLNYPRAQAIALAGFFGLLFAVHKNLFTSPLHLLGFMGGDD